MFLVYRKVKGPERDNNAKHQHAIRGELITYIFVYITNERMIDREGSNELRIY